MENDRLGLIFVKIKLQRSSQLEISHSFNREGNANVWGLRVQFVEDLEEETKTGLSLWLI